MALRWITRSSRRRLAAAALLAAAYAGWLAFADTPLTRAASAAGRLPEFSPGFGAPDAVLRLGGARIDYFWLQLFDVPAAILIAVALLTAQALMAARLRAPVVAMRPALMAAAAFLGSELAENFLLAGLASGALREGVFFSAMRDIATNLKFASLFAAAAVISVTAIRLALQKKEQP